VENVSPARSDIHILLTIWRLISLRHRVKTGSEAHPEYGYWRIFPRGAKRPGREAYRSPPSTAEINEWHCTSTVPYAFVAW